MNKINISSLVKLPNKKRSSYKYMIGVSKEILIADAIPVYTDGSCINNGKSNAVSSIGIYFPTKREL